MRSVVGRESERTLPVSGPELETVHNLRSVTDRDRLIGAFVTP